MKKGSEILKYYDLALITKHLKAFCDYVENEDRLDWHGEISYFIDDYLRTIE